MEILKQRRTPSQSRKKLANMVNLFEKYVDEEINTITIWSPTSYLINDKWSVDLANNKVERSYSSSHWDE